MNRILFEQNELDRQGRVEMSDNRARHVRNVLSAAPGDRIKVGLINGPAGDGHILTLDDRCLTFQFVPSPKRETRPRLDLLLAAPRPKVMKRLWSQLASLGVDRIIITGASKVEACYFDSHAYSPETWRPRLIEGLQQAGNTHMPSVQIIRRLEMVFEDKLNSTPIADVRLVLHPGEPEYLLHTAHLRSVNRALLALGPEAGWNDRELELLSLHRFHRVGMGTRTLRSDTACIAALCITAQRLEAGDDEFRYR